MNTIPYFNIDSLIESARTSFNVKLKLNLIGDDGWGFLKEYPVQLFPT